MLDAIASFGRGSAERDNILEYFLMTDSSMRISEGDKFLVLGRKGTGKTAIVRNLCSQENPAFLATSVNLSLYPWHLHEERSIISNDQREQYFASWYYLIAILFSTRIISSPKFDSTAPEAFLLQNFLKDNYGKTRIDINSILIPKKLELSRISLNPSGWGFSLGSIEWGKKQEADFGSTINSLSDRILDLATAIAHKSGISSFDLHFDELDRGLSELTESKSDMIIGLVKAADVIHQKYTYTATKIRPFVYLRTDIWNRLEFSDKNKIFLDCSINLDWNTETLRDLVNLRIGSILGINQSWETICDSGIMAGKRTKWQYVLERTFLRPRDVIAYLNFALNCAKKRDPNPQMLEETDIENAREGFSSYLAGEISDEISPHWRTWRETLKICQAIGYMQFSKDQFESLYDNFINGEDIRADQALSMLFQFSIIGYKKPIPRGGSRWIFNYEFPDIGWDNNADSLKIHQGLKEHIGLREGSGKKIA